jgi:hypothetical protein
MARIEAEYMPSIQELQRRAGLTAPDFSVGSREQNFATREEATRAARPMRAEGLAGVYRGFGDVEKADELMDRADAARLRDIQFEDAQLGLKGRRRTEAEAEGMQMAQQLLTGAEQAGQPITSEFLRVVSSQTGANYNALVDSAAKALGFQEASATATLNKLKRDLSKAAAKDITGLNAFLAENFDPDSDDDIKPEVTKDARGNFVVTYGGRVLPQYGVNQSLDELVARTQGFIDADPLGAVKSLLDMELRRSQIRASDAQAAAAGRSGLQRKVDDFKELYGRDPTDDEKAILIGLQSRPGATKDLTSQQQRAYDALKGTDAFKRAVERGDQPALRALLVRNNIPPEVYFGEAAEPPGGGSMTPAQPEPGLGRTDEPVAEATDEPVAEATDEPIAAPAMGLTREQTQARADQEMSEIQQQTRTRRTAIQTFDRMPQVEQAIQAARDLRRAGRAAEANNIEILINERRQEYVESQLR